MIIPIIPQSIPYINHSHGIYKWNGKRNYSTIPFPIFTNPTHHISLSNDVIRNMDVWFYGIGYKLKREQQFWLQHKIPKIWDYFSCMSVCTYEDILDEVALNHSGLQTGATNFHYKLMSLFRIKLGDEPYGTSTVTKIDNPIGNCSEQNAANDMLVERNCEVNELKFSKAIRPRTMAFIPPCDNCVLLFPQIVS